MTSDRWQPGETVVRREVLHGHVWCGFPVHVVEDGDDLLAVYLSEGSTLGFPEWPFDRWEHPWRTAGHERWSGHGKLMLHRPQDAYSVDLFWDGPHRIFSGWYLNLQDPFRRHERGFDTLDHELDYWVPADGRWTAKDEELFEQRIAEGRYSAEQAVAIRSTGAEIVAMLEAGSWWWDEAWAGWSPPGEWQALDLPAGWDRTDGSAAAPLTTDSAHLPDDGDLQSRAGWDPPSCAHWPRSQEERHDRPTQRRAESAALSCVIDLGVVESDHRHGGAPGPTSP